MGARGTTHNPVDGPQSKGAGNPFGQRGQNGTDIVAMQDYWCGYVTRDLALSSRSR